MEKKLYGVPPINSCPAVAWAHGKWGCVEVFRTANDYVDSAPLLLRTALSPSALSFSFSLSLFSFQSFCLALSVVGCSGLCVVC